MLIFGALFCLWAARTESLLNQIAHRPVSDSTQEAQASAALNECRQFNPFQQAMASVGSIPYDAQFNNCYDHSKELAAALGKQGIKSSVMVNKDRTHAWLAVWIEATTGHFISPENAKQPLYQNIMEVRDGLNPADVECYQNK